ncbi:hypothetical protein M438DRAFT_6020 [Aureobasidium pullulans EXF-150]|uniref:Uncharacterized protein n=1 Tax=Aureobasidium pullulans EXF-150 TaxID=1043002 RepID=A0A074Y0F1_AURPU|nr:uncharacterized protein M438DRAFT_6020 [Aureobasidium pullulans EXF-150]KEQ89399.1 hypothetical protein M438DRAFT_6020 [Aureobasidium pullulans EXF-150]
MKVRMPSHKASIRAEAESHNSKSSDQTQNAIRIVHGTSVASATPPMLPWPTSAIKPRQAHHPTHDHFVARAGMFC